MLKLSEHIVIAKERIHPICEDLFKRQTCPYCVARVLKVEVKKFYTLSHAEIISQFEEFLPNIDLSYWRSPTRLACPMCLDISAIITSSEYQAELLRLVAEAKFEFSSFGVAMTFSSNILIRTQSFQYYLQDTFGYVGEPLKLKDTLKWPISNFIQQSCGAHIFYNADNLASDFNFNLFFDHALNRVECDPISPTPPEWSKQTPAGRNKKFTPKTFDGQKQVLAVLTSIKKPEFLQKIPKVHEAVPEKCSYRIEMTRTPFYLAGITIGRYNKYSRNVSQSPWLINGPSLNDDNDEDGRIGEASTQELIAPIIQKAYGASGRIGSGFFAAGREDIDVRMLGRGRPFVVELFDAKFILTNTPERIAQIQEQINNSTQLVRVSDLQVINKEMTIVMKEGEETKKKIYRALVELSKPITPEILDKLNTKGKTEFTLDQKTPIRVLHRCLRSRVPLVRPKIIYNMKCEVISPHFLYVDLVTQAGTYIKEFVHGDLGRTTPSFQELMGIEGIQCDILLLDVMAVDLEFPARLGEVADRKVISMAKEMEEYIRQIDGNLELDL